MSIGEGAEVRQGKKNDEDDWMSRMIECFDCIVDSEGNVYHCTISFGEGSKTVLGLLAKF